MNSSVTLAPVLQTKLKNQPEPVNKTIFLRPTSSSEIYKILQELKDKNGGIDGINTRVLKNLSEYIISPLVHIFNLCIVKSVWPKQLKMAEVVPIFKSGDKHLTTNYRPISLISNIAKILEKTIHTRLLSFLNKYKIIAENQYGFQKGKGTKDVLAFITKTLLNNLNEGIPTIATFLDLAKAFDTVNHYILKSKLERYGIRGKALMLLSDYLSDRTQFVRIKSHRSSTLRLETGVPQGTILGPLILFIIYINVLLTSVPKDKIISYADNTVILSTGSTWDLTEGQMNYYLNDVNVWMASNELSLNLKKTVYIAFGIYCDSVPCSLNIYIDNNEVKRVYETKYLGIIIDSCLKWDKHVSHIISKTRYLIFVFYKLRLIFELKHLLTIYYAFFNSLANYGIIPWGVPMIM